MNDTFLQLTQSVTKLYSYLNTFNKNYNSDSAVDSIPLKAFIKNSCISEINNINNNLHIRTRNGPSKNEYEPFYDDLALSLVYWLGSLIEFISEKHHNEEPLIAISKFIEKKNGRIDDFVILLECISKIVTLISDLLKITQANDKTLSSAFTNNLYALLHVITNTFNYSNKLENSENKDDRLMFIKFYKSIITMINKNWIGKLAAIAVVYLSSEENEFDMMIMNSLFKYAFTLELNGAIQAQKNIRSHKFVYQEYLNNDRDINKSMIYGNVQKIKEEGTTQYKLCNIDRNRIANVKGNDYSLLFSKVSEESNYISFQYHLTMLSGKYLIKHNYIYQYYQRVKHLQDFDKLIFLSSKKNSNLSSNSLLMLMNGTAGNAKLSSATKQFEDTMESLSRSFLKSWLDLHITIIEVIDTTFPKEIKQTKIKEIVEAMFDNFNTLHIDFVTHSHGKLLCSFVYEYCLFDFFGKLKYINASYLQLINWDYIIDKLNLLIHSCEYNNIALSIGITFSYWSFLSEDKKDKILSELIIQNWTKILSPEVRGFSLIDVLLSKFFIYKQVFLKNQELLKLLVDLELKNQYNKELKVSIEYPNDPLILPNFRKLLLFKYPDPKHYKVKTYDIQLDCFNKLFEKNLPKINVKSIVANKELPNPNSSTHISASKKQEGSFFNTFINDISKTFSQLTQPQEILDVADKNKAGNNGNFEVDEEKNLFIKSDIEEQLDRVHFEHEGPSYFFKMSSLDAQLLKTYFEYENNSLDISQDLKETFKTMKSMIVANADDIQDPLIQQINNKPRIVQEMKMSKKALIDNYNRKWNAKSETLAKSSLGNLNSNIAHNSVDRSMDDSFVSNENDNADMLALKDLKQSDISSKIFKFINDTNNQISESLVWSNINAAEEEPAAEEELKIQYELKLNVMHEIIKSHLLEPDSKEGHSNNNIKKFVAVFNKTLEEYELSKTLFKSDQKKTADDSKIVIINEFLNLSE